MNNVVRPTGWNKNTSDGGEPPMSDLEKRVAHVEQEIAVANTKLDGIGQHYATKADLANMQSSLIKWMVGTMLASAGLAASIAFGLARLLAQ